MDDRGFLLGHMANLYSSEDIHASAIAINEEDAARQLRNLISSAESVGSEKSLKILTDDTRSPSAFLDEILDRSG
jgi:hypothetical protein